MYYVSVLGTRVLGAMQERGSDPGRWVVEVVEVEPASAVQCLFGRPRRKAREQHRRLIGFPAVEVDGEAPAVVRPPVVQAAAAQHVVTGQDAVEVDAVWAAVKALIRSRPSTSIPWAATDAASPTGCASRAS